MEKRWTEIVKLTCFVQLEKKKKKSANIHKKRKRKKESTQRGLRRRECIEDRSETGTRSRGRVSDWSRVGLDMAHTHTPFGPQTFLSGSVFSLIFFSYIYCCPPFLSSYFKLNEGYYIMAILWDSQEVVGGPASDVWLSSARRRVELQAGNTQHNTTSDLTHTHTPRTEIVHHYPILNQENHTEISLSGNTTIYTFKN